MQFAVLTLQKWQALGADLNHVGRHGIFIVKDDARRGKNGASPTLVRPIDQFSRQSAANALVLKVGLGRHKQLSFHNLIALALLEVIGFEIVDGPAQIRFSRRSNHSGNYTPEQKRAGSGATAPGPARLGFEDERF